MKIFGSIIRVIDRISGIVAELLVFLLMLLVTADIIARYLFLKPIPGQVEGATLSLVLILYLGLAYTQRQRGHIRVDLFISKVEGRKRELLEAIGLFLCLIVSVFITWVTAEQAIISVAGREFIAGVISFPVWPGRCGVTFGFALLSLTLTNQIYSHVMAALNHRENDMEN